MQAFKDYIHKSKPHWVDIERIELFHALNICMMNFNKKEE